MGADQTTCCVGGICLFMTYEELCGSRVRAGPSMLVQRSAHVSSAGRHVGCRHLQQQVAQGQV
jgi:hypothetical protein